MSLAGTKTHFYDVLKHHPYNMHKYGNQRSGSNKEVALTQTFKDRFSARNWRNIEDGVSANGIDAARRSGSRSGGRGIM